MITTNESEIYCLTKSGDFVSLGNDNIRCAVRKFRRDFYGGETSAASLTGPRMEVVMDAAHGVILAA